MKFYLFIISFILMFSLSSAIISELPDYVKLNNCVNIVQNDNVTTEYLVSIVKPDGIDYINSFMTKNNSFFNYTYCNNTVNGGYTVNGIDNTGVVWSYDYYVNAQGKQYNQIEGIIYLIMFVLLLAILGVSLYFSIEIEYSNSRGSEGELISINWKKYLKLFMFAITYVSFLGITFFAWNISSGILEFDAMSGFFNFIYTTAYVLMFPILVILFVFSLILFVTDKKNQTMLERGLTVK